MTFNYPIATSLQSIHSTQRDFYATGITRQYDYRILQLKKLKSLLIQNEKAILDALYNDLHKSEYEAYGTELGIVYGELDKVISSLHTWMQDQRVTTPFFAFPATSYIQHEPLGLSLIISPWNYPAQLTLSPLIGSIAAGNCVVIKPSELSNATTHIMAKIINENFNNNYLYVAMGDKEIATQLLALRWDHIFYTGSTAVGKIVYQAAAQFLTPVVLELGGKSPCIVDSSSNLKLAARRIAWGKTINCGQTCIAPDYILVHDIIKDKFCQILFDEMKKLYNGDFEKSTEYGKIINIAHFHRLISYMNAGTIVHGGSFNENNLFIEPTLLAVTDLYSSIMQEEIFGPLLPIVSFDNEKDIIPFINKREKPLALYIFSENSNFIEYILQNTSSGGVCVNDTLMQIANSNFGFGGVGHSGMGAYHGKLSFEVFSHKKSVMRRGTWLDINIRYAPYTKYSLSFLKRILKYTMNRGI